MKPRRAASYYAALGALLGCACSDQLDSRQPVAAQAHLAAGLAAKVGAEDVAVSTVASIASAQRLSLPVARQLATRDALFAAGARAAFSGGWIVPVVER